MKASAVPKASSRSDLKVRLPRTSSAHAVYRKERKKSVVATGPRLDEVIDGDESVTNTVTGKLPVEAAYVVMRRVTAEVGQPLNPVGMSTFNKLQSLKTTPAVDLLLQKTWRDFFEKKTEHHRTLANVKNDDLSLGGEGIGNTNINSHTTRPGTASSSTEAMNQRQKEMKKHLNRVFVRLVSRIEHLWGVLKLPEADKDFYRGSLCKGPPHSVDQCREMAAYVCVLKRHHDATVAAVQAIQVREMTVAKCFDVLAALQRKFSRNLHQFRDNTLNSHEILRHSTGNLTADETATILDGSAGVADNTGTGRAFGGTRFGLLANTSIGIGGGGGIDGSTGSQQLGLAASNFWKEELITVLDDVRGATLEVIRRIQHWRRQLWRPHPFVWSGENYVAKMKEDLTILESDIYRRILRFVPLRMEDLQGIVFLSGATHMFDLEEEDGGRGGVGRHDRSGTVAGTVAGTGGSGGGGGSTATTRISPTLPAAAYPALAAALVAAQKTAAAIGMEEVPEESTGAGAGAGAGAAVHGGGEERVDTSKEGRTGSYIDQLLHAFNHRVDPRELEAAATIVLEEETLQSALAIEQASLLAKGVFIPTLHFEPTTTTTTTTTSTSTTRAQHNSSSHHSSSAIAHPSHHQHDNNHHHHHQLQQQQHNAEEEASIANGGGHAEEMDWETQNHHPF
mmetsp:Transcript_6336/g.10578  ORF Transcript_6336/g.10578 Transcript_6336/m.10578 type:complete len:679 (+) Transcript_6336:83-2119(+)